VVPDLDGRDVVPDLDGRDVARDVVRDLVQWPRLVVLRYRRSAPRMRRMTYDYKARQLDQPAPDQVKAARQVCHLTQAAAAALVHRHDSSRWREWERTGPSGRVIDLAIWELFLIKSGLRVNP